MNEIQSKAAEGFRTHQPVIVVGEWMDRLADDLDTAPYCADQHHKRMWDAVGNFAITRYEDICGLLDVRIVDEPPYDTHDGCERMFADIANGYYYVQTFLNNNPHPFWPCRAWKAFRTVHDIDGHIMAGGDFTTGGEEHTFRSHTERLPEAFWPVLFSETLHQVASTNRNHRFPEYPKALVTPLATETIALITA